MIIRSKHDKRNPYLTISMKILRDRRLTPEERDCLIMMLSNVDDWEFSYTGLASQLGIRRETVKARVQGLMDKGYVSVSYPTGENGKPLPFAKGVWEIREEPVYSAGFLGTRKPAHACPISSHEDLVTRDQALENSHEDLVTRDPAQRTTEGVLLPQDYQPKEYQPKEYQGENQQLLLAQAPEVAEEVFSPTPNKIPSSESSSEANASPLSGKNSSQSQVMTQREFEFQQFLKKYPKAPLTRELEDTRRAFFEATALDGSFAEIMAGLDAWCGSAEWRRDNGRWIKKPMNWLKEHQWKPTEDLLSDARKRQLDELFPTEEGLI